MGSRKGRGGAAATPAIVALRDADIDHTVHTYEVTGDATYGDEAARVMGDRLGVAANRVFKTLVLATGRPPEGSRVPLAVAVLPVTSSLDLKAAAAALGCGKAALAPIDVAEKSTGYVVGGVSPVCQRRPLATVVDASALDHPTILCSAGRRGWEIELAPAELVAITRAVTTPIAAG
ncbi:aminoacyl-tRNA deacylase [Dietzia sp. 111N12-1]|uniref:aminoacyl-tRNA deacylase n=1 Tax=Dietzia sp. 111N12-1 TaxID=1785156 RepID=UPI000805FEED|nr:aminoacyl-tRNA deacylase [Dietzia sp. 111N12-1]OAV79307.1 aminoacyl-tRNA deacylase [Dietzia sp. 111N12-1]